LTINGNSGYIYLFRHYIHIDLLFVYQLRVIDPFFTNFKQFLLSIDYDHFFDFLELSLDTNCNKAELNKSNSDKLDIVPTPNRTTIEAVGDNTLDQYLNFLVDQHF